MSKKQSTSTDWEIPPIDHSVIRFERYLKVDLGFAESTVFDYTGRVRRYLVHCDTADPTAGDAVRFRDGLIDRRLSKSSINNYSFVVKNLSSDINNPVGLQHIKNNGLPYFFLTKSMFRRYLIPPPT